MNRDRDHDVPPAERALLAELGELLDELDPVPATVIANAHAAGELITAGRDWRWLELLHDSSVEPVPAVLRARWRAHAPGQPRLLEFTGAEFSVALQVNSTGGRTRAVTGLLTETAEEPALATATDIRAATVCWPAGGSRVSVDGAGRFAVGRVPAGPLRVVLATPTRPVLATRWFTA